MIFWAIVAGALIGLIGGAAGFVLGGMVGALMGLWLRSAIQTEIEMAIGRRFAGLKEIPPQAAGPAVPDAETEEPVRPAAEPAPERPAASAVAEPEPHPAAPLVRSRDEAVTYTASEQFAGGPSPIDQAVERVRDWFLGGNTIVRVGLLVLFVGLVFLIRLVAAAGYFPLEARLAAVGLAGAALLGVGVAKRVQRPDFALHLQGGGVAVMYLTVFAAARVYAVMPAGIGYAFMILFAALGAALAVMQNSLVMALAAFLGGYAVPILLGGEAKTPLGLFSYMTILNLAVLGIAWKKSWRSLNLLGFLGTVALAGLWGLSSYEDHHFLICEAFLGITVAIYLAMALFYAHNTPGKLGNFADSTLLFGTAIIGFGFQAAMVHDKPYASAWSAIAFGAIYLAVTAWTMRRKDPAMRLLSESLLAIGVGFVTLAVPLALDTKWTSTAWALEGAGAVWVGARQARWMPRAFGLALQALAAIILLSTLRANVSAVPFANNGFFGPLLIALAMLFTAWLLRTDQPHSGSFFALGWQPIERGLREPWFLGGFLFAVIAALQEVSRALPAPTADAWPVPVLTAWQQGLATMLALLGLMALADWLGRRKDWAVATWPGRLSLLVVGFTFLFSLVAGRRVIYFPDLLAWLAALALHAWLLHRQDRGAEGASRTWNASVHTLGALLLTAMLADALYELVDRADLWNSSWSGVVFLVAGSAVLAGLTRWAGPAAAKGAAGLRWPLDPHARAYWWRAAGVLAVLVWGGAVGAAWFAEGISDPLPYLPMLNPIDLSVGLAALTLVLWQRMLAAAKDRPSAAETLIGPPGMALLAALGFVAINGIWVRTAHHFMGVPWDYTTLTHPTVLTGFSILWTLLAMALMLVAKRRGLRLPWLTGAALLAVVVCKLLFVDMGRAEGFARIVAFIAVGVLMLLIGYFVPLPPRKAGDGAEENAA